MIIAKKEKEELFSISISNIQNYLKDNKNKKKRKDILNLIKSLNLEYSNLTYKNSFLFLYYLSDYYVEVLGLMNKGLIKQEDLQNKNMWYQSHLFKNKEKLFLLSVFFVYRYLLELNPEILSDFRNIERMSKKDTIQYIKNL